MLALSVAGGAESTVVARAAERPRDPVKIIDRGWLLMIEQR